MIPEAAVAMLACARIGAVHSIVFGGFSPDALAVRVEESDSSVIITSDEGRRGGRRVPLKKNVDAAIEAMENGAQVKSVVVVKALAAILLGIPIVTCGTTTSWPMSSANAPPKK